MKYCVTIFALFLSLSLFAMKRDTTEKRVSQCDEYWKPKMNEAKSALASVQEITDIRKHDNGLLELKEKLNRKISYLRSALSTCYTDGLEKSKSVYWNLT